MFASSFCLSFFYVLVLKMNLVSAVNQANYSSMCVTLAYMQPINTVFISGHLLTFPQYSMFYSKSPTTTRTTQEFARNLQVFCISKINEDCLNNKTEDFKGLVDALPHHKSRVKCQLDIDTYSPTRAGLTLAGLTLALKHGPNFKNGKQNCSPR
jgi:hypothetical protein